MIEKRIILTCGICKGEGELYGDDHIENCGYCHGTGEVEGIEKYEEEFEGDLNRSIFSEDKFITINHRILYYLLLDYLNIDVIDKKVKIKAKKGKIVIEGIE